MQPLQPKTKELNYFSNMSMILDVQLSANKLKQWQKETIFSSLYIMQNKEVRLQTISKKFIMLQ